MNTIKYPGKCILLDCDGVIADFTGPIVDWVNDKLGTSLKVSDINDWDIFKALDCKHLQKECFAQINAMALPVHVGAWQFYDDLRNLADVEIVTSPFTPSTTWESDRRAWLQKYFAHEPHCVHFTNKKHLLKGDVLIDDGPHNINDFPGPVVIIDRPWNQVIAPSPHPRYRCETYHDAFACVENVLSKGSL